jgi:hypothetical protein
MRYTDPRILTTLILGMLFTGVFAYAVYTASLDNSVFQAPTIKADTFYVGAQTLANYIVATAPGATVTTQASPYNWIISKVGGVYYANSTTGAAAVSNANFNTFWTAFEAGLSDGDAVYFKAGTYIYSTTLTITGVDNLTITGDKGAVLQCDTVIATAGFRWIGTSEDDHDQHATVRGLTFDNNLLTSGPFFKWVDHLVVEDCYVLDTVNATLRGSIAVTASTLHPNLDVRIINNHVTFAGGSGIVMTYTENFIITGNYVNNVCQFDYPAGGCIQTGAETDDGVISGNVLTGNTKNDGVYAGVSTDYGEQYTITGNTIVLNDLHDGATSGIKIFASNSVVSDNSISLTGVSDGGTGLHICGSYNVVANNRLKGAGTAWAGIYLEESTGTDGYNNIRGNIITGFDTNGIDNEQSYNYFADNQINVATGLKHEAGADQNNLIGGTFEGCTSEFSDAGTGNLAHAYINKTGSYVA